MVMNEQMCMSVVENVFVFVFLSSDGAEEQPVGKVSNLRVVESLGSTVRLGWTGVAGATQYRIIILNTECQYTASFY